MFHQTSFSFVSFSHTHSLLCSASSTWSLLPSPSPLPSLASMGPFDTETVLPRHLLHGDPLLRELWGILRAETLPNPVLLPWRPLEAQSQPQIRQGLTMQDVIRGLMRDPRSPEALSTRSMSTHRLRPVSHLTRTSTHAHRNTTLFHPSPSLHSNRTAKYYAHHTKAVNEGCWQC